MIPSRNIINNNFHGKPNTMFKKSIKDIMLRINKTNLSFDRNKSMNKSNSKSISKSMNKSNSKSKDNTYKKSFIGIRNILKNNKINLSYMNYMKIVKSNVSKIFYTNLSGIDVENNKNDSLNKSHNVVTHFHKSKIQNNVKNDINIIYSKNKKNKNNGKKNFVLSTSNNKNKIKKIIKNKTIKQNNIPSTIVLFNKNNIKNNKINKNKLFNLHFNSKKSRNYDTKEIFWHTGISNSTEKKTNRFNESCNTVKLKDKQDDNNYEINSIKKIPIIKNQIIKLNNKIGILNNNSKKMIKNKQTYDKICNPSIEKKTISYNNNYKSNNYCDSFLMNNIKKIKKGDKNLTNYNININQKIFDINFKKGLTSYKLSKKKEK